MILQEILLGTLKLLCFKHCVFNHNINGLLRSLPKELETIHFFIKSDKNFLLEIESEPLRKFECLDFYIVDTDDDWAFCEEMEKNSSGVGVCFFMGKLKND